MTREEAIKRIKARFDKLALDDKDIEAIQTLIPELCENEDERIRKELIAILKKSYNVGSFTLNNKKDLDGYLAYLEKQKEEEGYEAIPVESTLEYKLGFKAGKESEKHKEQKPIKIEVYEVGKGTTICGQDYKCKKDYKEGNCWYIKDVIYHCGRDGFLTDHNGVSWSCTPEWFNEYIYTNNELADKEKNDFVSGQFLQCKLSFDGFKEGEHYWLEYVGDDTYVGRSDNILNQKFHITPRQLFTLFSQKLEEVQGLPQEEKQVPLNHEPPFDENPSDKEIIEALINHLNEQDGFLTAINCVSTKAILSWLIKQKEQDKCPEYCVRSHCIGCSIYEKQKEQIPYTDFVIKPHKDDDNNPYNMQASEALEYAIKRGFGIPFNDGEVYVDVRHMTQTIGNIIRWADEHPKEQKPVERSLEDDHIIGFVYDLLNEIEWKDNWAMSKDECLQRLNNYSPQKPVELSEEDRNNFNRISAILVEGAYVQNWWSRERLISKDEMEKLTNWLKSLPERFNLQPNQEWSEEDSDMICEIIDHCIAIPYIGGTLHLSDERKKELKTFLKSLHPKHHTVSTKDTIKFGNLEYERCVKSKKKRQWKPGE